MTIAESKPEATGLLKAKEDLLSTVDTAFPSPLRLRRRKVCGGEVPLLLLKRYVEAELQDLCGVDSSMEANARRVAGGLERSAHLLLELAVTLRRHNKGMP